MHASLRRWALALGLSALFMGCAPDLCDEPRLALCDIRDAECQRTLQEATICVRGAGEPEDLPPIRVISVDELEALYRGLDDPMTAEVEHAEIALRELDLLAERTSFREGQIAIARASVLAVYSRETSEVMVVDRGIPMDSDQTVSVLVHELVHAAQHVEGGLDGIDVTTHEELSRRLLAVEGEATFFQLEALAWAQGVPHLQISWSQVFERAIADSEGDLDDAASPYFHVYSVMPYVYGGRHAAGMWARGGDAAVRAVLADPPSSSGAFLRDPFSADDLSPEPLAESPCGPIGAPVDHRPLEERDRMGALLVYAYLARAGVTHEVARSVARRVRHDELALFYADGERSAFAWRIHLAEGAPAVDVLSMSDERRRVVRTEDTLLILGANAPGTVGSWAWSDPVAGCAP